MPAFQILKEKLPPGIVFLTVRGFLDAHTFEELEHLIAEMDRIVRTKDYDASQPFASLVT